MIKLKSSNSLIFFKIFFIISLFVTSSSCFMPTNPVNLLSAIPYYDRPTSSYVVWKKEHFDWLIKNTSNTSTGNLTNNIILATDLNFDGQTIDGINGVDSGVVFDGGGHTLENFTINKSSQTDIGFIGKNNGTVKNIIIDNATITGGERVGGIVGSNSTTGRIENCASKADVKGDGLRHFGGITGYNSGTITMCYNEGNITGGNNSWETGGIVGNNTGTVSLCYNKGYIKGHDSVGGIAGKNDGAGGSISNCYNTGKIESLGAPPGGQDYTGGIVGQGGAAAVVTLCYNIGEMVSASARKDGIVGNNGGATGTNMGMVSSSYFLQTTTVNIGLDGIGLPSSSAGALPLGINDFYDTTTWFTAWDFVNFWKIATTTSINGVSSRPVLIGVGHDGL